MKVTSATSPLEGGNAFFLNFFFLVTISEK